MQTVTYYVGDLVPVVPKPDGGDDAAPRRPVDMRPIIDLLTSSVAPGTWSIQDSGDRSRTGVLENADEAIGSITPFFLSVSLIVRHTAEVHEEIGNRLRQLRLMKFGANPEPERRGSPVQNIVTSIEENPRAASRGVSRRTVYVPRPKFQGLDVKSKDQLYKSVLQVLNGDPAMKVVYAPEGADLILNWSLTPRVKGQGDPR